MDVVPTLETGRLRMRAFRREDFGPLYAIQCEPAVHRHFGPQPIGAEECWRRMLAAVGGWVVNGVGPWAVERKSDGALVGNVGLFISRRDLEPDFGDEPEMGWVMATETHGQGIAFEACDAALRWAEQNLEPTPIWAIVAPANAPSLTLGEKLGFERLHETTYGGEPTVVLRRPAWG